MDGRNNETASRGNKKGNLGVQQKKSWWRNHDGGAVLYLWTFLSSFYSLIQSLTIFKVLYSTRECFITP